MIFGAALRELAAGAGSRLLVVHWLDVLQGLPTASGLVPLIRPFRACQVYASGPDPFLSAVRRAYPFRERTVSLVRRQAAAEAVRHAERPS